MMPDVALWSLPRTRFTTLPTALERGPQLPGGARLWVKRDDLTGLGLGGNKARKLEFLCADALNQGAQTLITVGAGQSNHCRMTAAAGARLGMAVHLVLAGERPVQPSGNQLLSMMFGAQLHYTGAEESHWGELEIAREALAQELAADGLAPYSIPIGGSTALGAVGYAVAFDEIMQQAHLADIRPRAIVVTSSSGGTHAGLVAGRAVWQAEHRGGSQPSDVPEIVAIGVAKGVTLGFPDVAELAQDTVVLGGSTAIIDPEDVETHASYLGDDYAVPTVNGDAAINWAAQQGGWVLDRVYTGKGLSGLLDLAAHGRWSTGDDVIFVHTGGTPAVFAPGGSSITSPINPVRSPL